MHNVETMMYTGEPPWHRLGTAVAEAPTAADAMRAAGLDWTVVSGPIYTEDGTLIEGWQVNRRTTDGAVLGVASDRYQIIQNAEASQFVDDLLGLGVTFETAGALDGGRRVWMTTRLRDTFRLLDDPITVYLTLTNGHDGRHALHVMVSPVRVVCQNTLNLAMRQSRRSWTVAHTTNAQTRLAEARDALKLTHGYLQHLQSLAADLTAMPMTWTDWQDLVHTTLMPKNPEVRELPSTTARRDALLSAWLRPDHAAFANTAWAAVNAVAWFDTWQAPRARNPEQPMRRFLDGTPLMDKTLRYLGIDDDPRPAADEEDAE